MNVIDLKTQPVAQWKQTVIDHYRFAPYWWLHSVTPASRQALMSQELDKALAAEKTHLWGCVSDEGDWGGFAQMRWLEWDTNHFGFETWRLDHLGTWGNSPRTVAQALVQKIVQVAREQGYQNLQARIPIDDLPTIHALEEAGFQTMEILNTVIFEFAKTPILPKRTPGLVRDFGLADTEALVELARIAYTPTPDRFHVDPHLAPKVSNELYAEWMRNSCSGQLADHISVAESDGKAIGYITTRFLGDHGGLCNIRIGQWLLGALAPDFRSQGLIEDVVSHGLEWLNRRQADICFFGTQVNNFPSQRAALRVGFRPAMTAVTLHYWPND
jgi:RimJ/RimL family protein N-acetyltransferase